MVEVTEEESKRSSVEHLSKSRSPSETQPQSQRTSVVEAESIDDLIKEVRSRLGSRRSSATSLIRSRSTSKAESIDDLIMEIRSRLGSRRTSAGSLIRSRSLSKRESIEEALPERSSVTSSRLASRSDDALHDITENPASERKRSSITRSRQASVAESQKRLSTNLSEDTIAQITDLEEDRNLSLKSESPDNGKHSCPCTIVPHIVNFDMRQFFFSKLL